MGTRLLFCSVKEEAGTKHGANWPSMDEHSSEHSGNIFGVQTQSFHIIPTNSKLLTTFMTYFPWQSFTIIPLASALTFLRILQAPDIQLLLQAILTVSSAWPLEPSTGHDSTGFSTNLWMRNLVPNMNDRSWCNQIRTFKRSCCLAWTRFFRYWTV